MRYAVILFLVAGCTTPTTTTTTTITTSTTTTTTVPIVHADDWTDDTHLYSFGIPETVAYPPAIRLPTYSRPSTPIPSDRLRRLVETYMLPADVDLMLRVAWCESGYNTNAKNSRSTASGLFQHLKGWWSGAWGVTGPFDPFNPEQSVKAAADLLYETTSGIDNWKASYHCWWQTIG